MHDEPAPLSECLELDPDYFDFLEEACGHGHARVRAVASALRASIEEDVQTCRHARKPPTAVERRLEAAKTTGEVTGERYFALSGTAIARLNDQRANNRYPDRLRNSNTVRSSSNNKTTTTTTTTTSVTSEIDVDLVFPCHLNRAHRTLALKYLDKVPAAERQAVLDELEGRIQAEKRGARPLWDVMGYLARLCERARTGEFNPNLGIPVAEARQKLARPHEQSAAPDAPRPAPLDREKAREQIQRLREIVGRPRPK